MPLLSLLPFRRRSKVAHAAPARVRRHRAAVLLGSGEPLEPRAMLAVIGPADGIYKAGSVLEFRVTFPTAVTVTGTPTLPLTIGSMSRSAVYASGTNTNVLLFRHAVIAGDNDADGIALASSITLPSGGSIRSTINGNDAVRTFDPPALTNVRVDTTAPVKPGLPNLVTADDTGSSNTDNYTSRAAVTLDGIAEANGTVAVFRGLTQLGSTTANGSGVWSLANVALLAGANAFTVKVTDAAGNVSPVSDTLTVTRDSIVPATPALPDLIAADDTGSSSVDNVTRVTQPTVAGTAEAGAVIGVYVNGNPAGTGVAGATGLYSIKLASTLSNGTYPITVKATDRAGNTSASSLPLNVTIDTSSPSISSVAGPAAKTYKSGDALDFEATFDQVVTVVTGVTNATKPSLGIQIGGTEVPAVYLSGSGSTKLKFRLTVVAGQLDSDGVTSTGNLAIPAGSSIRDAAGNDASTGFSGQTFGAARVDAIVPVVASMTVDGSTVGDGPWNSWKRTGVVTFSRPVTGVTTGDFTITGFFYGATRTVRLNDPNVAAVVGEVRVVPLNAVGGYASTWYLDVRTLPLQNGTYSIDLIAAASGIADEVGNSLLQNKRLVLTVPLPTR